LAQLLAETPLANDQEMTTEHSGSVLIRARLPITPQLKRWVLSHGDDIEVVEPQTLRREIIRVTRGLVSRYSTSIDT
jgi:predicted DNA-binding transcriptional regulator YafY